MDLALSLDNNSKEPLYQQIYNQIKNEITEGKLLPGQRLPSARSFAMFLQVSRSTVDLAYEQLRAEGYIEARQRSGFFICELASYNVHEIYSERLTDEVNESDNSVAKKESTTKQQYSYKTDFSPYEIDMSVFPTGTWKKISREVISREDLLQKGDAQGDKNLRETLCRYLYNARGVKCLPEQIIVGAGNDYLLLLLEKIMGQRQKVAVENPSYKRACQIFNSFSYELCYVGMDEKGMLPEVLDTLGATLVYCMPSHQFPMGVTMTVGRRMELLKWATRTGGYLIEDDYDSEFRYKGRPIPSLQSMDTSGRVIYMGTFSKSISSAWRFSYMVLPMELLEIYKEKVGFYSCTVSRFDQQILTEFISEGYFERHLNRMRKHYREKRDYILKLLIPFQKCFEISGEDSGLHLVLKDKQNREDEELVLKAKDEGVRVYGLNELMFKKEKTSTVILGYGRLSLEEIEDGINKLKEAWL